MTWESHDDEPTLFFERLGSTARALRRSRERGRLHEATGTILVVEAWRLPAARALIKAMGLRRFVNVGSPP